MCEMKIGDLVKYVYNTDHTDLLGIGIITDTGKNNSAAPKNIYGNSIVSLKSCP